MNLHKIGLNYEITKGGIDLFSFEDNYMEKCFISQDNAFHRNCPFPLNMGLERPSLKIEIYVPQNSERPLLNTVDIDIPSGWTIGTTLVLSKHHIDMILPIFQMFIDTGGFDETCVKSHYLESTSNEAYEEPKLKFERRKMGERGTSIFSFADYNKAKCHITTYDNPRISRNADYTLSICTDQSKIKVKIRDLGYVDLGHMLNSEIISLPFNWKVNTTLNFNKERLEMIMPILQRFIETGFITP